MNKYLIFILLVVGFLIIPYKGWAQETEEDPYSDYSYLWEDSKAKEKEAKRKAREERKQQKQRSDEPTRQTPADTVPSDTLELPQYDSLSAQPNDSLQINTTDAVSYPDILKQEDVSPSDTLINEGIPEEPEEEKKEKRSISGPPVQDFRAGMQGSGSKGAFNGGFTFTLIDDQYYAGLTLQPEFSIGKVGVGLNVPILYGLDDKTIRTEMFEDGVGVARLITYIRYGVQKRDPVYVKVGQLNNTMIGFGGLINNYTNTTSFEKRKVGLHYDFNIKGLAGIDGLYSDFNPESRNLLAIRPYIRPLAWLPVPIIRTFEFGYTHVSDKDNTSIVTSDSTSISYLFTENGISSSGFDAGLTLLRVPFIQIDLFGTYSKLQVGSDALVDSLESSYTATSEPSAMADGFSNGSGYSAGMNFRFHFIADLLSTDIRIERLKYTEHYLPQFFDATYEINKDARIFDLGSAEAMSGIYGSLTGHILQKVQLGGSILLPDEVTDETPATVRVHADVDRLGDKISIHGSYIKGNLTDLKNAFTFDERSLAKVRFIYHLNSFLAAGVDYYWAFTPTGDGGFEATKYVSPYFGVSIQF